MLSRAVYLDANSETRPYYLNNLHTGVNNLAYNTVHWLASAVPRSIASCSIAKKIPTRTASYEVEPSISVYARVLSIQT